MPASRSRNTFKVHTTPMSDFSVSARRSGRNSMGRTGRKTFKTDKMKKQAVWPETVEAALLEALEMYTPPPARGGRARARLQRFPKRNKVIAHHIFKATGQIRSAKQVGSRIQQLRQTCRDPGLFAHLTDRSRFEDDSSDGSSSARSSTNSRAQSEVSTAPSIVGFSLADQFSAPSTPALTPTYIPVSHMVSMLVSVVDGDWNPRSHPAQLFVDLDHQSVGAVSTTNLVHTTTRSQLHVPPSVTVRLPGIETLAVYRNTFTVYSNEVPLNSQSFEISAYYDGTVVAQLAPDFWTEILSDSPFTATAYECVVVQTIGAPDSAPEIEITYKIEVDYQSNSPSPSPLSSPCSSSYSSPAPVTPYGAYSFDYSALPSPSNSASFSLCPPTSSYTLSLPIPSHSSFSSYANGSWPLSDNTSYQLQEYPTSSFVL
ncbi:hypothetical protein MD484_g4335, partial [Candolleomyces efflorescens]